MLCLSRRDIENIGEAALTDCAMANAHIFKIPLNLVWFAQRYLGLRVEFRKLSENGRVLGLTVQSGVAVKLPAPGGAEEVTVREDTVFLDESLSKAENVNLMRFTLAHECAHQILARLEESRMGYSFRELLEPMGNKAPRELKTAKDWHEWQANSLAAVLLMPKFALAPYLASGRPRKLISYDGRFDSRDYAKITEMAKSLAVSRKAMSVRLEETGHTVRKPASEFCDPLDITAG